MLHPSYSELIQAINNNAEEDDNTMMLNSRSGTCNQQESKTAYCRCRTARTKRS